MPNRKIVSVVQSELIPYVFLRTSIIIVKLIFFEIAASTEISNFQRPEIKYASTIGCQTCTLKNGMQ